MAQEDRYAEAPPTLRGPLHRALSTRDEDGMAGTKERELRLEEVEVILADGLAV